MTWQAQAQYPYPSKIDSIEDVRDYLSKLYRALVGGEAGVAEKLEYAFQDNWAFKTITGITNDVVADQKGDTLTLAKVGPLTIVGTAATDTITWTWAHLGIESLTDPGGDRIAFWDDGETACKWLAPDGTTIEISGTTLQVLAGGLDHGTLAGLADDDHTHYSLRNKGIISGCVVSDATGIDVNWTAGYIYDYDNTAVRTISSASTQAVSNNSVNFVYFDPGTSTTVLQRSTTRPTDSDQVLVATVCAQDADIVGILNEDIIAKRTGEHELSIHEMFPTWVTSGGLVSAYTDDATSDLDVIMDALVFIAGGHHRYTSVSLNSEDNIMTTHFHDASNNWDSSTANVIDTANYDVIDDSAGLINIPSNKWVKGMFYFSLNAINYVYPTAYYTTEAQGLAAPLPATPPGMERCVPLTAIVFQQGETDIGDATFLDIRPGFAETIQFTVSDHGSLGGLSLDDHPQYILHSLAAAENDFLVASGANTFVKQTLAATGAILEGDIDHGNIQGLDTGADHSYINQDVQTTASPTFVDIIANHIALGGASANPDYGLRYQEVLVDTDNSPKFGINANLQVAKTSAVMTSYAVGFGGFCTLDSSNTQNWTRSRRGMSGVYGAIATESGSSGTVSEAACFYAFGSIADAAIVTNLYGLYVQTPGVAGSKAVNEYGIYIEDQNTASTLNYAIYTNAGLVHLGDNIFCTGLKSGTDQTDAGAAVNELYIDTDGNTIKIGV